MKIEPTETKSGFKPVSFTITCESQRELDGYAAIFDNLKTATFLSDSGLAAAVKCIEEIGGNPDKRQFQLDMILK